MPDHSGTEQCAPDIVPEEAVRALRNKIIADIETKPCTRYLLASLLFSDAAECFPTGGSWGWDGAWFFLDLNTGSLSADVSTYPNQFGASREDTFPLSASEFHRIAEKKYFSPELRQFQTEEDWQRLFDSRLKAAVADAQAELRRQQEEKEEKERKAYAVRIPSGMAGRLPEMNIDRVDLGLIQMYGNSSLVLTRDGDTYSLSCVYGSRLSSRGRTIGRKAGPAEAALIRVIERVCPAGFLGVVSVDIPASVERSGAIALGLARLGEYGASAHFYNDLRIHPGILIGKSVKV